MKFAICDDNFQYRKQLKEYFDETETKNLECETFNSGEDLIFAYEKNHADFDAIFLDMEMEKINGIETANIIRSFDKHVIIVFITSHTKYMQKSFECEPFRFLIKPVDFEDIKKVTNEVVKKLTQNRTTFVFTNKRDTIRLFCDDIIYFECQLHKVLIHTKDNTYKISGTISGIYKNIDRSNFFKIHSSYIVNLSFVKTIKGNDIELYDCEKTLPVSRANKKELLSALFNLKERKYLI